MPTSVVAWLAGYIGTTLATFVVYAAISYAISAVLAPRRRGQGQELSFDFASRILNQIQSDAPWRVIYGQIRAGGVIVFRHATNTFGSTLTSEDVNVPSTSPFTVQVQHAADYLSTSLVREYIDGGVDSIFTAVGSNPGPEQYSVAAGVYTFNSADAGRGLETQYNRTIVSQAHNRLNLVIVLAAHECQEIGDIYFGDEIVPLDGAGNATGRYAGHVYVSKHLGTDAQAADATLMAEAPTKWTVNHRLRGHAYLYVRLLRNPDLFPSGVPNITALTRGRKVFDSRTGTTVWSDDAALCNADYLNHPKFGINAPYATEIDTPLLNAAANVCDEEVLLAGATTTFTAEAAGDTLTLAAGSRIPAIGSGIRVSTTGTLPAGLAAATTYYVIQAAGGLLKLAITMANARAGTAIDITSAGSGTHTLTYYSEPRYTCNGMISTAETPEEIIGTLLTSMSGRLLYVSGTWRYRAGAYVTPAVTFDEGDLRGPIQVTSRLSRQDACNAVKGVYVSPDNHWQPSDFPPLASATFMAEDNGERIWRDLELPFTTSAATAQRIAKIELLRARQQISGEFPFKLGAYRIEPPETLLITNTRLGWSAKAFELIQSRLVFEKNVLGVDGILRETAASIFDWSSSEEQAVDPAPDTNLPNPFFVVPPGVPAVAETIYETTGSAGVKSKATVTWAASADGQAYRYDLDWKKKTAVAWERQAGISGLFAEVFDLDAGIYMFRVRALSAIGVASLWAQSEKELVGLTAPPADITGFAVRVVSGQALVTLNKHPDLDVRIGGRIVLRWSPLSVGATWNDGMLLSIEHYPGDSVSFFAPLLGGTYLAKAQDSSVNMSFNAVSFTLTEAHLTGFTTLGTATEHPGFTGAKINVAAVDGGIQLVGATLWDAMPAIDTLGMIDSLGGIVPAGTYTFANRIDLGSVLTVRLFPNLKSLAFDTADLWDSRTSLIDSWGLVDGNVIEDAEVAIEVRTTNDNPAGSPTWGPWHALPGQADYTARAFEFREQFTSGNVTHNRKVTELAVAAKQPT